MKILLVTTSYPPNSGSHTQRIIPMCMELVNSGIELSVLSMNVPESHPFYDTTGLEIMPEQIKVYYAPLGTLHKHAYNTSINNTTNYSGQVNNSRNIFKSICMRIWNVIKTRVLIPDSMIDWYFSAMRYVKKCDIIETIHPDLILSCSMPNTVHLISYRLSKKYNVPMYMDVADPWAYLGDSHSNKFSLRFKIQEYIERRIINHAIGMSFSAPGCRKLYLSNYNLSEDKTIDAMTGFEKRLLDLSLNFSNESLSNKLTFTYGGALQDGIRDPKPFFRSIVGLENEISVVLRTDDQERVKKWLLENGNSKAVRILPYIKFDDYYKEMLSSDVILFFGNSNDIQLPGKIFNCVATGKIILYLKSNNIENDTVETILHSYKNGIIIKNVEDEIASCLQTLINNVKAQGNKQPDSSILMFSSEAQFSGMARHIKSMFIKYCKG